MTKGFRIIAAAAGTLAVPGAAWAQEVADSSVIVIAPQLSRSDAAGARIEPGVMPQPIATGGFLLEPSLSVVGGYDTNVFNFDDAEGDAVVLLTPRLRVRADTSRHLVELDAVAQLRRFASQTTEDSEEFRLVARTRLDLVNNNTLAATGSYERQIEPRSSAASVPNAAEPVSFSLARADLNGDFAFGKLSVRPGVRFSESSFSSVDLLGGGSANQSFRDLRTYGGGVALGYRVSGLVTTFGAVNYGQSESTNPIPGAARDASDLSLTAGVRGELSPLVVAEVAAGYRKRDFDLDRFLDFDGFTYSADVQWFVTPLVTIQAQASQNFSNAGIVEVAGTLSNRASLAVFYDPLRNLRLSVSTEFEHLDFRETDTSASRPSARLTAQYFLSRNLSLGGFVGFRSQSVSGPPLVQSFTSFSTGIGITLTP